ncbi:MAG: hypothetical protein Q8M02_00855 [Candidatus Didemnitutus sp.]|nr:hypothetical protein [Candidatus Didemnitutus sp.]
MALKEFAHKSPAPLPATPAWGVVAGDDETLSVLRLEMTDRTESLPYHTLTRWTLQLGSDEILTIHAGSLVVKVRGRELAPVRDALDVGRLVSVRAVESRYLPLKTGTVVTGITVSSESTHE